MILLRFFPKTLHYNSLSVACGLKTFRRLQKATICEAFLQTSGGGAVSHLVAVGVRHGGQGVGGQAALGQVGPAAHAVQLLLLLGLVLVPGVKYIVMISMTI